MVKKLIKARNKNGGASIKKSRCFFLIEVELIYNVVPISALRQKITFV